MQNLFSNRTVKNFLLLTLSLFTLTFTLPASTLTRANYTDRVQAVWTAQILAVIIAWPHEHQTASTLWLDHFPKKYDTAPVDDDWYYEMVAIRGFEKYGVNMTVEQLGAQWKENSCGSWGSSEQARLNLLKGIKPPLTGHPRYNKLWFTLGPQFSADVYGALAPGQPNLAGKLARQYGHLNGYAEAVDGAVFVAGMVSLGFTETDPKQIVRQATKLIDPSSPYRQCLDQLIQMADAGATFEEIAAAIEDRWHKEYVVTNNAVANGGLVALCLWFGEADFLKTVNLAARAADFTDADCNAANAAAVIGAMHGMNTLPANLVAELHDRLKGDRMGKIKLAPPVDEKLTDLAQRTAAIGEKILLAHNIKITGDQFDLPADPIITQPAELFKLADLTQYWNPAWKLERAGFGGSSGGRAGIRGATYLEDDALATYPRDEIREVVLRQTATLSVNPTLTLQVAADPGKAWQLKAYADNTLLKTELITAEAATNKTIPSKEWHQIKIDLSEYANKTVHLRLYQKVLGLEKPSSTAYWKNVEIH